FRPKLKGLGRPFSLNETGRPKAMSLKKGEWQTTEVTRFIKTYKKLKSKFDGLEYKVAREIWELKDLMAKKDEYTTHLVEDQSWMLAYNTLQTKVMGLKASLKDLEEYAQVMVPNRVV
ncbi:hypothetical protein HAX54_001666, partial [Datura stramonium]|nr:hypothetical protein [Datura stramonium]